MKHGLVMICGMLGRICFHGPCFMLACLGLAFDLLWLPSCFAMCMHVWAMCERCAGVRFQDSVLLIWQIVSDLLVHPSLIVWWGIHWITADPQAPV